MDEKLYFTPEDFKAGDEWVNPAVAHEVVNAKLKERMRAFEIQVGEFVFSKYKNTSLWMEKLSGEGMQLNLETLTLIWLEHF